MEMKIILAEEYSLIRAGLRLLIESLEEAEIAGEAGDGQTCLEMIKKLKEKEDKKKSPDMILLITEIYMPKKNGFEILREVKKTMPDVRVLFLTACNDRRCFKETLDMEADGILRKDAEPSELKKALQFIWDGKKYFPKNKSVPWKNSEEEKWSSLTKREREILIQTAGGRMNKEIADSLRISERTVKNHLSSIFRKLEVSDRTQAAVYAIRFSDLFRTEFLL